MQHLMAGKVIAAPLMRQAGFRGTVDCRRAGSVFFTQGDPADCVFFLESGRAKVTALSESGKEAIVALPGTADFFGEESLAGTNSKRITSAIAVTPCSVVRFERQEMIRMLRTDPAFAETFLKFLVSRTIHIQANLVDHMFHCSEKRLARILLSMAEFGDPGEPDPIIPKISQKQLAEMVGTTRSRVSFFMNRFRKMGFIEYTDHIRVNRSLHEFVPYD